jgi:hypothetical protein
VETKPKSTLWYFAYGSNISLATFTGSRGTVPIDTARVRLPGWSIIMEIPGLPYSEPSFSSIARRNEVQEKCVKDPGVYAVAYLMTADQFKHVIASEGGGIAYIRIRVVGEPLAGADSLRLGSVVMVQTLASAILRHPCPRPSNRYLIGIRARAFLFSNRIIEPIHTNFKAFRPMGHVKQVCQNFIRSI